MPATEINASIITIGDELLIGQTIDTNSAYIATALNEIGIWVKRRVAIGDVKEEILQTLSEESRKSGIIIITGGLGPTADDITKPALCEYFNAQLVINEDALQNVKNIFTKMGKPITERNLKQAEVPHNCTVLPNTRGTAPGMWFEKEGVVYISLPGVPHEMQGLMDLSVISKLEQQFQLPVILHKTLITAGKGESEIAEIIAGFENSLPAHIKLAYLPSYGMVKLRLTTKGADKETLTKEIEGFTAQLKNLVNEWLVAEKDQPLQDTVSDLLAEKKATVATAESCTGGYIAHLFTSRPGSSAIFKGGIVSYANDVKVAALQVQPQTLQQQGAVSEETVTQMAKGALALTQADYAIATSGIMGPDGGTPEKPAGTVWIAVAGKNKVKAIKHFVRFDRKRNIALTANYALNMLRLFIKEQQG